MGWFFRLSMPLVLIRCFISSSGNNKLYCTLFSTYLSSPIWTFESTEKEFWKLTIRQKVVFESEVLDRHLIGRKVLLQGIMNVFSSCLICARLTYCNSMHFQYKKWSFQPLNVEHQKIKWGIVEKKSLHTLKRFLTDTHCFFYIIMVFVILFFICKCDKNRTV